jgi:adenine phosphoribosyltransferase
VFDLKSFIRDVPDFPKKGILFKDITTLLRDPLVFKEVLNQWQQHFAGHKIGKICGIEARGFIFGAALAAQMGIGFVPVRKQGKLPWTKVSQEYQLEYGSDTIEIHLDAVEKGEGVLIVDDVLATGGTAKAVCQLLERTGARIEALAFLLELDFLKGRDLLGDFEVVSLIHY